MSDVPNTGEHCPRGKDGCGACGSLSGDWCITSETDCTSNKDTARMLAAGATRVLWLRTRAASLLEARDALLHELREDTVCICESNSCNRGSIRC